MQNNSDMQNKIMFIVGLVIFVIYIFFYFKIVLRGRNKKD